MCICAWRPLHHEGRLRRTSVPRGRKLVDTETLGARLPARDVGGSLGHSPSLPLSQRKGRRLGISPAGFTSCWPGKERARERRKRTQTTSSHGPQADAIFLFSTGWGECSWAPICTSSWPLPNTSQQDLLAMACFPECSWSQGPRPRGSSDHPLLKTWVPSILFPSECPHHSWRAG